MIRTTIRLVYTKKLEAKIRKLKDQVCYERYEGTAAYIEVEVFGQSLLEAGIKLANNLQPKPNYRYKLMLFRSQEELEAHKANAPTKAKAFIRKNIKAPVEPYEEDVQRPIDFFITDYFRANCTYTSHWVEIDMNSAEPYYVAEKCPELKEEIYHMYYNRKKKPLNKLMLNCINGNLRNSHVSIYKYVVNTLYQKMLWVMKILEKYGAIPFCMRRDAVIFSVPKNFIIPPEIPVGDKIGEFKVKRDYGSIRTTDSEFVYYTDMKKITTKSQGTVNASYLDNLQICCNKLAGKGLIIMKTITAESGEKILVEETWQNNQN